MTSVDKKRILPIMSPRLFTQIEGWEDGGKRTRNWLSRRYQKRRMACKCVAICFMPILNHEIGSAGCSVNWSSYGSASHQVSDVYLKSCLTAWTRHTSGY